MAFFNPSESYLLKTLSGLYLTTLSGTDIVTERQDALTIHAAANAGLIGQTVETILHSMRMWNKIETTQSPNWASINTTQSANWTSIDTTQSPGWTEIET
jgi:hypothetical protein